LLQWPYVSQTICLSCISFQQFCSYNFFSITTAPISLGWAYSSKEYSFEEYEQIKGPSRNKKDFYLPASKRTDLLIQEWQCMPEDIRKARRDATYIQYCREKTACTGRAEKKEAAFLRMAANNDRKFHKPHYDVSETLPPSFPRRVTSAVLDETVPEQQQQQQQPCRMDSAQLVYRAPSPMNPFDSEFSPVRLDL
jgi:hypothetical protein